MNITLDFSWTILLTIVFIVLKLLHKIAWSWVWVLSPIWIGIIISIIVVVVSYIVEIKNFKKW